MYVPDGSMGYHNMQDVDIIHVKLDLILHALKRADIPVADYMKYIRSGEYVYPNDLPNNKKGIQKSKKSAQT